MHCIFKIKIKSGQAHGAYIIPLSLSQIGAKGILQVSQGIPSSLLGETRESVESEMCSFAVLTYGILTALIIGVGAVIWHHRKKYSSVPAINHPIKPLIHTDLKVYPQLYPVQLDHKDPDYVSKCKNSYC